MFTIKFFNIKNKKNFLKIISILFLLGLIIGILFKINFQEKNKEKINEKNKIENEIEKNSKPKVIIISIDSLSSFHLSHLGYYRKTTPNIDRLALEGISFKRAYTPIPWTSPANLSLLTGSHPIHNKIFFNAQKNNPLDFPSIASIFEENGFKTGAIATTYLNDSQNFRRGFGTFISPSSTPLPLDSSSQNKPINFSSRYLRANNVTQQTLNFIRENKDSKFFLWVYYYDLAYYFDSNYEPEFSKSFLKEGQKMKPIKELRYLNQNELTPNQIEYLKAKYDDTLLAIDKEIGRVIEELSFLKIYDETTIIITADHGTSFSHSPFHGDNLYEESIRIPMVIKLPSDKKYLIKNHIEENTPILLTDIPQTLKDIYNLNSSPLPSTSQNMFQSDPERLIFVVVVEVKFQPPDSSSAIPRERMDVNIKEPEGIKKKMIKGVIKGNYKLIIKQNSKWFFDLSNDPSEEINQINKNQFRQIIFLLEDRIKEFFKEFI